MNKRVVKGIIIVVLTIVALVLLYTNYSNELGNLLKNTELLCNEDAATCYADLKSNVIFSKDARSLMIYTGIITLVVLNAGAFSLYYFCINKTSKKVSKNERNRKNK